MHVSKISKYVLRRDRHSHFFDFSGPQIVILIENFDEDLLKKYRWKKKLLNPSYIFLV